MVGFGIGCNWFNMHEDYMKKVRADAIYNLHEFNINPHTREIYLNKYVCSDVDDEGGVDFSFSFNFY